MKAQVKVDAAHHQAAHASGAPRAREAATAEAIGEFQQRGAIEGQQLVQHPIAACGRQQHTTAALTPTSVEDRAIQQRAAAVSHARWTKLGWAVDLTHQGSIDLVP